jgi:hypothetical protein
MRPARPLYRFAAALLLAPVIGLWLGGCTLGLQALFSAIADAVTAAPEVAPPDGSVSFAGAVPALATGCSAILGGLVGFVGVGLRGWRGALPGVVAGPVHALVGLVLHGWVKSQEALAAEATREFIEPLMFGLSRSVWRDAHDFGSVLVALVLMPILWILDSVLMIVWLTLGTLYAAPRLVGVALVWCAISFVLVGMMWAAGAVAWAVLGRLRSRP